MPGCGWNRVIQAAASGVTPGWRTMQKRQGLIAQILWKGVIGIALIAPASPTTPGAIAQDSGSAANEVDGAGIVDQTPASIQIDGTAANQPTSVRSQEEGFPPALKTESASDSNLGTPLTEEPSSRGFGEVENPSPSEANEEAALVENRESRLLPADPRAESKSKMNGSRNRSSVEGGDSETSKDALRTGFLDSPNWLLRTVGGLGAVLTILFLLRPLLKRLAGPLGSARAPSGVIEALARYPFGKGQFLVLLKLDRRILLICQTAQGSNVITEMSDPDEVASILRRVHDEKGESFNRKLEAILRDNGSATGSAGSDLISKDSVWYGSEEPSESSLNLIDLTATKGSGRSGRRSWFLTKRGSAVRHNYTGPTATVEVK